MIGSGYPEIKATDMNFLHRMALAGLAIAVAPSLLASDACELELAGLAVQVERRDAELDVAVLDGGLPRTRITLPADGPLRGCWTLDVDGDGRPEAVVATAVTEPGQPARLRAFHWTGERLEPESLPTLMVEPAFSDAPREQLDQAGEALLRTLKLGPRALHFRYNRDPGIWSPEQDLDPTRLHSPADSLLQAPIPR